VNSNFPHILLLDTLFSTAQKIYLNDDPTLHRQILWNLYDSLFTGHPGIANTWELVWELYEGPRLHQFIEDYIKGCAQCQESKTNVHQSRAPLQHFDTNVEAGPFQKISMDLITDLPLSQGYDSILMIVNQGCSKATKFIPYNKMITSPHISHPLVWPAEMHHFQPRPLFYVSICPRDNKGTRYTTEYINGVPPLNQWTDRENECLDWTVLMSLDIESTSHMEQTPSCCRICA
jgi:hypothetical protein